MDDLRAATPRDPSAVHPSYSIGFIHLYRSRRNQDEERWHARAAVTRLLRAVAGFRGLA
jgi:hypothetical protein